MEKLINNLNEFGNINRNKEMIDRQDTYIISKRFGFIEWLVGNDKIDTKKVAERRKEDGWSIINYNHYEETETIETEIEYWVDNTLMALSISDNPIQDLISLLK